MTIRSPALERTGPWIAGSLAVLVVVETIWLAAFVIGPAPFWDIGLDYRYYVGLGQGWLADGTFYQAHQLAGPYEVRLLENHPIPSTLYPPSALLLFVPFAYLPAVLWWAVPIGVTAYCLYRLHPRPWAWAVMLLLLAWPRAIGAYLFGNTDMWIVAAVAAGLVWGWPALAVTLKPTLAPLALVGIRSRSWWVAALVGVGFIIISLPLWQQYVRAMLDIRGTDLAYSLGSLPLMAIPLVAWLARR